MSNDNEVAPIILSVTPDEQKFKDETATKVFPFFCQLSMKSGISGPTDPTAVIDFAQAALSSYKAAEHLYQVRKAIISGQIRFYEPSPKGVKPN